ncbi:hypothetical protein HNY73_022310 [Argiope bruennichi]|uniref:Uncharacterized protein n=1 Tax=Argiope bruennichi TaxID=94029 RepID=A0A8T0E2U1_ARGBR|nr:hypothetical protein HNY73_022310 [Argiope bruennichi]
MFAIQLYQAFFMPLAFYLNSIRAASICSKDSSNPACNPNSVEFKPDYDDVFYRSENQTHSPDKENGNKTAFVGFPFFGNIGLELGVPMLNLNVDFVVHFNGIPGNKAGDKIYAELSSPMSNETLKFALEYLVFDKSGDRIRFISLNDTDSDSNSTTMAPTTAVTLEASKNSADHEFGMMCLKLPS